VSRSSDKDPASDRNLLTRVENLGTVFSRVDSRELAVFLDQFGMMLQCGLRPDDSLDALAAHQTSPLLAEVIEDLSAQLYKGHTLSEAMAKHSQVFPPTVIMLIRVGEQGGFLHRQLSRAGEMLKRTDDFIKKIKSAVTGPLITALFCALILFGIVKIVFPKFLAMYETMDIEFPAISQVVVAVVNLVNHPITVTLCVAAFLGCLIFRKKVQEAALNFLIVFGPTRPLVGKVLCATTCETLATLHNDGIPLHRILTLMSQTGPFPAHLERLREARGVLVSTGSLHDSLKTIDYFPSFFHAMVAIGEETGALDALLNSSQKLLEQEIEVLVDRLSNALEPAITVLMGVSMGVLFIGMFLPIYGILSELGGL